MDIAHSFGDRSGQHLRKVRAAAGRGFALAEAGAAPQTGRLAEAGATLQHLTGSRLIVAAGVRLLGTLSPPTTSEQPGIIGWVDFYRA